MSQLTISTVGLSTKDVDAVRAAVDAKKNTSPVITVRRPGDAEYNDSESRLGKALADRLRKAVEFPEGAVSVVVRVDSGRPHGRPPHPMAEVGRDLTTKGYYQPSVALYAGVSGAAVRSWSGRPAPVAPILTAPGYTEDDLLEEGLWYLNSDLDPVTGDVPDEVEERVTRSTRLRGRGVRRALVGLGAIVVNEGA